MKDSIFKPTHWLEYFFYAGLFVLLGVIYWPSLRHPPNADQIVWMLEMAERNSLVDLISGSYSWSRTRYINIGDFILFRPVLFAYLSLMKFLGGHHYFFPQLMGVVLHGVIVVLIFRILSKFRRDVWIYLLTLFFAVMSYHADMVTWSHIHAYMLAMIFLLLSTALILDELQGKRSSMLVLSGLLLLAVFTFEFSLIYCCVFLCILWVASVLGNIPKDCFRRLFPVLLIPVIIYIIVSAADYAIHMERAAKSLEGSNIRVMSLSFIVFYFKSLLVIMGAVFLMPFIPSFIPAFVTTRFSERPFLLPMSGQDFFQQLWASPVNAFNTMVLLLLLGALGIILWSIFRTKQKFFQQDQKILLITDIMIWACFLLFLGYTLMFIGGRASDRGLGYLQRCSYHMYYLSVFLFMALVLIWMRFGEYKIRNKWPLIVLIGALVALISLNAFKVFVYNAAVAEGYGDFAASLRKTSLFVQEHQKETGFSFQFVYKYFDDGMVYNFGSYRSPEILNLRVIDALFRKYVSQQPKYYLIDIGRHEELKVFPSQEAAEEFLKNILDKEK